MGDKMVLKSVAGSNICDFCGETKQDLATIGPFAMELPTHICALCYSECLREFTDGNDKSVVDWLESSSSGVEDIGWEIITEIHWRSLEIKRQETSDESFIEVGEVPAEDAEYVPFSHK